MFANNKDDEFVETKANMFFGRLNDTHNNIYQLRLTLHKLNEIADPDVKLIWKILNELNTREANIENMYGKERIKQLANEVVRDG